MRRRVLSTVAALAGIAWSWLAARDIPFSPITAGWFVGRDFPERAGIVGAGEPAGEMDDLGAYAREDFDPCDVHPDVRAFYEATSEFEMAGRVRWHRPFRVGAALAAPLTAAVEQLNLPGPFDDPHLDLSSRFVDVAASDPREGVRAWVRTDGSGAAVFVALYGSHVTDGERFVNVAVPLPGWNLSTVLRVAHHDGTAAGTGMDVTSRGQGAPGLYAVVPPLGAFRLPVSQRFRVWPADAPDAPGAPEPSGDSENLDVVATHEMWFLGLRFLTVTYGATRTTRRSGGR